VSRDPSQTVLYHIVADHLETFLASLDADPAAKGLLAYVQREFYDYLYRASYFWISWSGERHAANCQRWRPNTSSEP